MTERQRMHLLSPDLLILGLVASSAGCAAAGGGVVQAKVARSHRLPLPAQALDEATAPELVTGNNAFAFDLYRVLYDREHNLFYSPYSISAALAMTYAGASEDTEQQMAEALQYALPQTQLHAAFNGLDQFLLSGADADDVTACQTRPCRGARRPGRRNALCRKRAIDGHSAARSWRPRGLRPGAGRTKSCPSAGPPGTLRSAYR